MKPDDHPAHDDRNPPAAAAPDQARRGRAVVDFRPYPTAPTRTRRSPANPAGPTSRSGNQPPTPSTIWFIPNPTPHDTDPDTVLVASRQDRTSAVPPSCSCSGPAPDVESPSSWPPPVLTRAVTSFTEPGATVLLLPWPAAASVGPGLPVPADAVVAVTGLDRQPRLGTAPAAANARDVVHLDGAAGRVDLLVTAMPARHDAAEHTDAVARLAARELRLGGVLVVLTRCDRSSGTLVDPTGPMVTAGQNADLLYLQHIVAVHLPPAHLRDHAAGAAAGREPEPHLRVHSDVLVFAQPHDAAAHPAAWPPRR